MADDKPPMHPDEFTVQLDRLVEFDRRHTIAKQKGDDKAAHELLKASLRIREALISDYDTTWYSRLW